MNTEALQAQYAVVPLQWKVAGELPATDGQNNSLGFAGPVAGVHNNVLFVVGGANFPDGMPWEGGQKSYYSDGYLFQKQDDSLVFFQSFRLPLPIAYAANCSVPQGIIAAGGENEEGLSNKVFLIRWQASTATAHVDSLPDLPMALSNGAMASSGHVVYLAGGESEEGVSNRFFCLDLLNPSKGWMELPSLVKPVSHSVLVVSSDEESSGLYLMGGRRKNIGSTSDHYASVYRFDLVTNTWQESRSLPYSLSAHSGVATSAGTILLFGGDRGELFHQLEKLNAAIAHENDSAKKQVLNTKKRALLTAHPGFSNDVLKYSTSGDKWLPYGTIPFPVPVTTTAVLWENDVIIPGGEIKPGVRTPVLLMGKIPAAKPLESTDQIN